MRNIITGLLLTLMSTVGWGEMDNSMLTAASNINATKVEITLLFTALLSVFLIILSFRVLDLRGSPVTKWLHSADRHIEQETLERAIRGQAILLSMLNVLASNVVFGAEGASEQLLLGGTLFTIGRLMHGIVFSFMVTTGNGIGHGTDFYRLLRTN